MSAPDVSARISIREFAKRAACDEKQVRRALEKGLLFRGDDGMLAAEHVDSDWRKTNRRGAIRIAADNSPTAAQPNNVRTGHVGADNTRPDENVRADESVEEAAERIVTAGGIMSLVDAQKLKENYLARHQQLSYDLKAGSVVMVEAVAKAIGAEYAGVRKKLLAIPAERAPTLHRLKTVVEVEDLLRSVIVEALEGLISDGILPA